MMLPRDILSENYRKPKVILCQTNKDKICPLDVTELEATLKFNGYSEISFNVSSIYNDLISGEEKPTPYYDYVEAIRLVYLEGFGYFQLQNPELCSDGIKEYKHINAYSLEYSLSQRYLETFIINKGDADDTIGSIDGVVLYNQDDTAHSLLHLVLQKAYGWSIGHVDDELKSQSRSFDVDRESIYDFIMNEMCDTFKCYVEFDTINNTINLYSENNIERFTGDGTKNKFQLVMDLSDTTSITINGHAITQYEYNKDTKELSFMNAPAQGDIIEVTDEFKSKYDTDVIISFENLSNEMKVDYSADDIKTVLTVKGADDLDIRSVNFGLPSIINLDYYCTPEWMGEELYNEYLLYMDKQDKYMSGFYSKDVSGSTEESFDVVTTKEDFNVGAVQEFIANGTQESFNVNGEKESFNIDKATADFVVESIVESHKVTGNIQTFVEPELQIEKIDVQNPQIERIDVQESVVEFTYDGTSKTFSLPEEFVFNNNSIVKVNNIVTNNYTYNKASHTLTYNGVMLAEDVISVSTCKNEFNIESTITDTSKITLNDRTLEASEYQYSDGTLKINSVLKSNDIIRIFIYDNVFKLEHAMNEDSVVYVNNNVINSYVYNSAKNELTVKMQLTSSDILEVRTPLGKIVSTFEIENIENAIINVTVDGNITNDYSISDDNKKLIITNTSILSYGSTVRIELVKNNFALDNFADKIIDVKINNISTNNYSINNSILTINDKNLHVDDIVLIELINMHFDLSQYGDKSIVSVFINDVEIYSPNNYTFTNNVLSIINYNLANNDTVRVKLVNNYFVISNKKDKVLSVKIDNEKLTDTDYSFDKDSDILTINNLNNLFNGEHVYFESVDEYFILNNTNGILSFVIVDGVKIKSNEFSYNDNKLIISSNRLLVNSNVTVEFVDNYFYVASLDGNIYSVSINGTETKLYNFDEKNNLLIINDKSLARGDTVQLSTIDNKFYLSDVENYPSLNVMINNEQISEYIISSNILIINKDLHVGDIVSISFINNHFSVLNDIGTRHIVEKKSIDSLQYITLQEGNNGYMYDTSTNTLIINVPLQDGDEIRVRTIDSTDALLIVEKDAKDGEIQINNVLPVLNSYTPSIGDYVIKIDSYTEILKKLYKLIDDRLEQENSIPTEYNITEIKLNPDNLDQESTMLPEANIEHLGEVYKITNQNKIVEEDGTITYNDISSKYYVCEMKMSTYKDDSGSEQFQYKYSWNERDLIFGENGIKYLQEKIDIYSSVNSVQISAEWDQKPQDSNEYKSYVDNVEKLQKAKEDLENMQNKITDIDAEIQKVKNEIETISKDIDISRNFSISSLNRLSSLLREDEYSDDCFCVTDIDTDLDIINVQKELLVAGYKKLKTISQPKLSFTASIKNIYAMPEFEPILHQFNLGNFIKVKIRPDFIKKSRLLEVQIDFEDLSNFSCTFGDLLSVKDQGDLHADLLSQAINAGKVVANESSNWQRGYDMAKAIEDKIKRGLIDVTTVIKSDSAGQDISWDNYGIHLRKKVDGVLDSHEGWITNNKFLYSDDNFKTTKSVFGNYTIDGETYWGILAGCVSAGLIDGSTIVGGEVRIGVQEDGTYAFKVDRDGTVTMNKGDAADKLSYLSFDGNNGLIIGENKDKEYFSRISPQRIEFCRKARIITVTSEPKRKYDNYDYILYIHTENSITYYDYYKNPDFLYKAEEPSYEARSINEDFTDSDIRFGIPITYYANNTAYMKQAEIEGGLKVGTVEQTPSIYLGNFKLQIEGNGSLSIVAI